MKSETIDIKLSLWYKFLDEPFLAAALDLSLLSQCNHTILSYGTYSFWAGFLAGQGKGLRIIPAFFEKYRTRTQTSYYFNRPPFESNLPRFYHGMKFFRWQIIDRWQIDCLTMNKSKRNSSHQNFLSSMFMFLISKYKLFCSYEIFCKSNKTGGQ